MLIDAPPAETTRAPVPSAVASVAFERVVTPAALSCLAIATPPAVEIEARVSVAVDASVTLVVATGPIVSSLPVDAVMLNLYGDRPSLSTETSFLNTVASEKDYKNRSQPVGYTVTPNYWKKKKPLSKSNPFQQ